MFLKSFKPNDRHSVNNSVFLSQSLKAVPQLYDDFEGFGKLGVSSFKLNWDYSLINRKNGNRIIKDKSGRDFERIGRYLSKYSSDDLRLASCGLWKGGNSLNEKEKDVANNIKNSIVEELQLL